MNELVRYDAACRAIAAAKDIGEVREIRNVAEAMRAYAKQAKNKTLEVDAAEIRIRSERRVGELIEAQRKSVGLNAGAKGVGKVRVADEPALPTLAEAGIDKNLADRARKLAAVETQAFEYLIAEWRTRVQKETERVTTNLILAGERAQAVAEKTALKRIPDGPFETDAYLIIQGDCAEESLQCGCNRPLNWIITDPPYGHDAIPLYADLSRFASARLQPGGSCLVMTGELCLPEVLAELTRHLTYHWMLAWLMPGGQPTQVYPRKVSCFWKPILWLTNGPYTGPHIPRDVFQNAANAREKIDHPWGQAEAGFAQLIETFTMPGDLICDPFCGGGTTGAAAVKLRRKFIGIDIDPAAVDTTRQRLAAIIKEEICSERSKSAI